MLEQGRLHKVKTVAEEMLEELEERVTKEFHTKVKEDELQVVAELDNKIAFTDPVAINKEKLKGKFKLCFNHDLEMH